MTLRLTIDHRRWHDHIASVRTSVLGAADVVPVVKGNGYGIGRADLAARAATWSTLLAMGTVHEALAHERFGDELVLVLTPMVRPAPLPDWVVPTVGGTHHLAALADHRGQVAVKLLSDMARYGCEPEGVAELVDEVRRRGHTVHSYVLHLPLPGTGRDDVRQARDIEAWLASLDPHVPLSVSHLGAAAMTALAARHPERRFQLRAGTSLWHGDKSFLHLGADVVDVRPVAAGATVGYRSVPVPDDGWLVMVGAGSSHGVAPQADGLSPFHHLRRRLLLLEAPHMHTSMCFVAADDEVPAVGDWVDVQRPLILVQADEVTWT
jgi:alanine racemase